MASFDHLDLFLDQYWLSDNPLSYLLDPAISPSADQSITVSGSGSGPGSDPEAHSNPKRSVPGPVSGRVGKRKPRPSKKKSSTTFITADEANFRQMVHEVTGVKLPPTTGRFVPPATVVRPEPQRLGAGLMQYGHCLPTLDTSVFLLDRHDGQRVAASQYGSRTAAGVIVGDGGGVGGRTEMDFDSFSCFPTLESWKVM